MRGCEWRSCLWDASALVPLCVNQATNPKVHPEYKRFAFAVWWGAYVEVYGALSRLHREKKISGRGKQGASERLRSLSRPWREVLPSVEVRDLTLRSLEKYPLRADGLQLAASLVWCAELLCHRASPYSSLMAKRGWAG